MGMPRDFIATVQTKVAVAAVGQSVFRGQGPAGMQKMAQQFLRRLHLRRFAVHGESTFQARLDVATAELLDAFPRSGRSWGAARKSLNLFLRDALHNLYLRSEFGLREIGRASCRERV